MVNTRAQTSAPAVEVTVQNEVPPAGNPTNNQPEPDTRRMAADIGYLKEILLAVCANTGTAVPGAPLPAAQASSSKRERRREATRQKRANRLDRAAAQAAPSEDDQNEAESHPAGEEREDSPEGRNPRNSRGHNRAPAAGSNGERASQAESRHPRQAQTHHQGNTELRNVLNARRGSMDPSMEEKVKVLWDTLRREKPTLSSADLRRSPFALDLRTQPLPSRFKVPVLEGYDGSKDPMDHLNCFRTHLSLQGASEALMCQCFPITLRGDALLWFHGLPPNSICSFDELADSFLSQFASSRREERQPWHLVRIRQGSDESLKRFLDRFIAEARRIPHLSDELKLNAFVATLAAGEFFKHLSHQRPQTFREAETIALDACRPRRTPPSPASFSSSSLLLQNPKP